jgi:hypothetical protein
MHFVGFSFMIHDLHLCFGIFIFSRVIGNVLSVCLRRRRRPTLAHRTVHTVQQVQFSGEWVKLSV